MLQRCRLAVTKGGDYASEFEQRFLARSRQTGCLAVWRFGGLAVWLVPRRGKSLVLCNEISESCPPSHKSTWAVRGVRGSSCQVEELRSLAETHEQLALVQKTKRGQIVSSNLMVRGNGNNGTQCSVLGFVLSVSLRKFSQAVPVHSVRGCEGRPFKLPGPCLHADEHMQPCMQCVRLLVQPTLLLPEGVPTADAVPARVS